MGTVLEHNEINASPINSEENISKSTHSFSGAEILIKSLLEENVEYIFGYPGGAIMPVYDSLYMYKDRVHHILTRHEQGAVHAAQGYARTTGKVGVCFATSGPGATNLITGIADAYIDSTPLVCVTGQVASHLLGTDAFQETDVIGISTPVTKWDFQITRAEEIAPTLAKAFYIARSGRPGPVLIDITKDAQIAKSDYSYTKCRYIRSYKPNPIINFENVNQAAHLINQAKKPLVVFGQGIHLGNAEIEFLQFIEKSGIPAASTLLGLSAFPSDHPLFMGMLGMHGNYAPNVLTNECDLLIAIGMRFDDRVTGDVNRYAKQAKVIHIEIDDAEINKIVKADIPVHADVKEVLPVITSLIHNKDYSSWINKFHELQKMENEKVIVSQTRPESKDLKMGEIIHLLSEKTNGEAIVVTDVGQHQMIASRYYKFKKNKGIVTSGGLGTMGFCLPAAIGAKLGNPNREVIAVIGDGGFQMTLQELGTILQSEISIKVVILNNHFLGMVRQWQQLFFDKRYSATEMINPDFIKIVEAYNIKSKLVTSRENLSSTLDEFLNCPDSMVLDVHVEKEDNVFPMVPTGASVSEIRLD